MSSWVRYSVAVYVGLLLAGTIGSFWKEASATPPPPRQVTISVNRISELEAREPWRRDPDPTRPVADQP